jgi:hypothetical protein
VNVSERRKRESEAVRAREIGRVKGGESDEVE